MCHITSNLGLEIILGGGGLFFFFATRLKIDKTFFKNSLMVFVLIKHLLNLSNSKTGGGTLKSLGTIGLTRTM